MTIKKSNDKNCTCFYKLILLDCNMPVLNGYETCQRLLNLIKKGEIPKVNIIACTADETEHNKEKCINYKFNEIIYKPINRKVL